jgi:hypothetical protein
MLENRIAVFGGVFLGLGLVLLFILFFWLLRRSRFAQEKEETGYGGLVRGIIFIVSILCIVLGTIFFQIQDYMRPFSEWINPGQVLSSEKLVAEMTSETVKDSTVNLFFNTSGKKGEIYKETFEVSVNNRYGLVVEILIWEKWLKFFGFVDGYKLTQLNVFPVESSTAAIRAFELSGGPAEGWKKIYGLRKILPFVKPEELKSEIFILNPGETKKFYIKDKRLVVE